MSKPLEGVRVIGVEQYIAAPYCTMLMADLGAEVIKIERPGAGDPRRSMPPMIKNEKGEKVSGGFIEFNRNKKSMSLDIQSDEGKEILKKLVRKSDILIENFRPGVMDRLGIGYKALSEINPGLVYVAISGFGQLEGYRGPYWERPAFDIVTEAMSGYMHMIGHPDKPPQQSIYGLSDIIPSLMALTGAMVALFDKQRTGKGRFVDISMYDSMVALNERSMMIYSFTGKVPCRGPETLYGPRGSFKAKNGYVVLNIPSDYMWERLCKVLGQEHLAKDERCKDGQTRAANTESFIRPIIEEWFKDKTKEEVVELLLEGGVPAGEVQTAEDLANCPHLKVRKMIIPVPDEIAGERFLAGNPLKFSGAEETPPKAPPKLGEHTQEILKLLEQDD